MFQEKKNSHPRRKYIIYSPKLKLGFPIPMVFTHNIFQILNFHPVNDQTFQTSMKLMNGTKKL